MFCVGGFLTRSTVSTVYYFLFQTHILESNQITTVHTVPLKNVQLLQKIIFPGDSGNIMGLIDGKEVACLANLNFKIYLLEYKNII